MKTRPPSTRLFALLAASATLSTGVWCAHAQTLPASEIALRNDYGVASWAPPSATRSGVAVSQIAFPGLQLRARTDRPATDGGIELSFGTATTTTLLVNVVVTADSAHGRDAILAMLRPLQSTLVPLAVRQGADVAFGDAGRTDQMVVALFGNVAVRIQRTHDAGAETPGASHALAAVRARLGAIGSAAPTTMQLSSHAATSSAGAVVIDLGNTFEHVEARVTGGFVGGTPGPRTLTVMPEGSGPVRVEVTATDAWGRTVVGQWTVPTQRP